ncbi:unnamed protein product [Arabidopsis thaliana]|uniref:(thale cress) hypothetical protein n=1 Tax=Arabidopsis thaliana TaxID=3702 RepID=A0A7G2ENL2_ARATH|nr:unnamed protein product [Arabidopsis thaliana]
MKTVKSLPILAMLLGVIIVAAAISTVSVEGRKHHVKKIKPKHRRHSKNTPTGSPAPAPYPSTNEGVFNIFSYGAKGDGVSDDSKALVGAWKAACKVVGGKVEIPAGKQFLVKAVTLQGPCKEETVVQIEGILVAPEKIGSWPNSSLFQWLNFKWVSHLTIQGSGTLNGRGSNWWNLDTYQTQALRFYSSNNVTVRDISIVNSPLCHLKFDDSDGVKVNNVTISSPENSPNTDGIHLQNTRNVEIQHSNIACGGLGKDKSVACVSDIIVEDISIQNTLAGVRIKTWQGGLGVVKNLTFSNIQVKDVKVPIVIDQYYCDKSKCKNQTRAVSISGVKYNNIVGSFTVQPVRIACSNNVPCMDVDLMDIRLRPSGGIRGLQTHQQQQALCWNSYGKTQGPLVPSSIGYCLRKSNIGGYYSQKVSRSYDKICPS